MTNQTMSEQFEIVTDRLLTTTVRPALALPRQRLPRARKVTQAERILAALTAGPRSARELAHLQIPHRSLVVLLALLQRQGKVQHVPGRYELPR